MRYKFHNYKFDKIADNYYDVIRRAMFNLGHFEVVEHDTEADIHFYNHTTNTEKSPGIFIVKPTAPTSQHFGIDIQGYANSGYYTFNRPPFDNLAVNDWSQVEELIKNKANKWDDSVLLKWRDAKNVHDDHILIIGQIPDDETVNGFGFGDHIKKLDMIVDKLYDEYAPYANLVIKLHPRYKNKALVKKWKEAGHHVITGFDSIHSILPKTKVAIIDNSTAGIECMMHDVPIISYGYPEYHWITKDLRILTELKGYIEDMSWFDKELSRQYLMWYINWYLCHDVKTTQRRLEELLDADVRI